MPCNPQYESWILDYLDDSLSDGPRMQLEQHIEHCSECARYLESQRQLEAEILNTVAELGLSDEFSSLVLDKIDADRESATSEWISRRKLQLEAEFANGSAQLKRIVWTRLRQHWPDLLIPAALGAAFIWLFTVGWVPKALATSFLSDPLVFSALLLTLVFIGLGFWCGRQDLRRALRGA